MFRRGREVKNSITLCLIFAIELFKFAFYLLVNIAVGEVAFEIEEPFGKTFPGRVVKGFVSTKLGNGFLHGRAKLFVAHRVTSRTQYCKLAWDQSLLCKAINGGKKFASREIACRSKDHQHARRRGSLQAEAGA